MASAGITALLKKMDYKDVVIAIDGSLFRYKMKASLTVHDSHVLSSLMIT